MHGSVIKAWLRVIAMLCVVWAATVATPAQACWRGTGASGGVQFADTQFPGCYSAPSDFQSAVLGYMESHYASETYSYPYLFSRKGYVGHAGASPFNCTPQPVPLVNGSTYYCEVWVTNTAVNLSTGESSSSFAGVGWFGLQYSVDPQPQIHFVEGASSTHVLAEGGPGIAQKVQVTGPNAAGMPVQISGAGSLSGIADSSGFYTFIYMPGTMSGDIELTANCAPCQEPDHKTINVVGSSSPNMCPYDPGKLVGNPIVSTSGEKVQAEPDWIGSGPHALSFTRYYRSAVHALAPWTPSGWGSQWSHNYTAGLSKVGNEARVTLGDGGNAIFLRDAATSPWLTTAGADRFSDLAGGGSDYVRASDESHWRFDAANKLVSITGRNGWVTQLAYDGSRLASVTNAFGASLQMGYDSANVLSQITTPNGQVIRFALDATPARLTGVTNADSTTRTYLYEDSRWPLALTGIINEAGVRYASFAYDDQGRATNSSHAGGVQSYTLSYPPDVNARGRLIALGEPVTANPYQITSLITDPLGQQQSYTFQGGNGNVQLVGAAAPWAGGTVATRSLDGTGLPMSESDFLGYLTNYQWDATRQLPLGTTRAAGRPEAQTTSTQWHPTFRLPVLVTEGGRTTAYSYDAVGNKLSETTTDTATSQTRTWSWTYNAQGLADSMTDPKGGVWQYTYNTQGNRLTAKNPLNQQTTYAYDSAGRVTSQTGPNGLVTTYTYDARDRLTQTSRAGETSSYTYTPFGQLASASLPNGYAVSYTYDAAQRLIGASDNRGNLVQYTLDAMGNRIHEEVKDASNAIALATSRVINNLNLVSAVQGATGQTTQLGYDANGEPVSQADPLNQTTRQTLDALRRPTATTFADNASASQSYNQLDQLTAVTDPKGVQTSYTTNAFGDVMSETSPDIGTVNYQRDALGNITQRTDAKGNVTTYTRDALGRPTAIQYAADHIVTFTYDASPLYGANQTGYLSGFEDKSGSTTYERDVQGRITRKTQTVNDNLSSPSTFVTVYNYVNGELARIKYPGGLKVLYNRDSTGRITGLSVQKPDMTPISPFITGLTWTALNQPKAWTWASGDSASRTFDTDGRMSSNEFASYSFDAASRITGITQSLVASTGTGSPTSTSLSWTVGYDNRNRITSFSRSGAGASFSYDANSNRLTSAESYSSDSDLDGSFTGADATSTNSKSLDIAATSNRLLGFTQTVSSTSAGSTTSVVTTPVSYSLDANGSMTSDGLRSFDYDASDRLAKVRIIKDGEAASISYLTNALGQRVFKGEPTAAQTLPDESTLGVDFIAWLKNRFRWMYESAQATTSLGTAYTYGDGALPSWALLGEYDNGSASGTGRAEYIWLPTDDGAIPVGMFKGNVFYAIHTDHLGTPRQVTDGGNVAVWQWPYNAFGNNRPLGVLSATSTTGYAITPGAAPLKATLPATVMNLRYPGQYADGETGEFYNFFRQYDSRTGRYTQADPIGLDGGWNRFGYVGGNPLNAIDPSGLIIVCVNGVCTNTSPPPLYDPRTDSFTPAPSGWSLPSLPDWMKPAPTLAKPPDNAYDPLGPKAPGKPGKAEDFKDPKGGENWVRNPNGRGYGWQGADGGVWCPTGPDSGSTGDAHGGPHWDVQYPGGRYDNVYPGGRRR
jgi:RHS repeat-associated protein